MTGLQKRGQICFNWQDLHFNSTNKQRSPGLVHTQTVAAVNDILLVAVLNSPKGLRFLGCYLGGFSCLWFLGDLLGEGVCHKLKSEEKLGR